MTRSGWTAWVVAFGIVGGLLVVGTEPVTAEVPAGATWTEEWLTSADGTRLHADVLLPARRRARDQHPTLLHVTPYGNHSGSLETTNPSRRGPFLDRLQPFLDVLRPFERGWAVVIVDLRGFGASHGCWDFMGPGERADTNASVRWTASQPWSNGRVGMYGISYDAFTAVWALADGRPELKAAVVSSGTAAIHQLIGSGGVHHGFDWLPPAGYAASNFQPGALTDTPDYQTGWASGLDPRCAADNQVENATYDEGSPYYRARDVRTALRGTTIPTLYAHGFLDYATKPHSGTDIIAAIKGERTWLGQYRHGRPSVERTGRDGFLREAARLLERHVARQRVPRELGPTVAVQEGPSGRWRAESRWPPTDVLSRQMTLRHGGTYIDAAASSGEPAPVDDPQFAFVQAGSGPLGAWSVSRPLQRELHLAGAATVDVRLDGRADVPVVADLYDVAATGEAFLVTRGAARSGANGTARIRLFPQDWRFTRGHRVAILVTGSDGQWWLPIDRTGQLVRVLGGRVLLPALSTRRSVFISGNVGDDLRAKQPIRLNDATTEQNEVPPP